MKRSGSSKERSHAANALLFMVENEKQTIENDQAF
jgi:hypothetical protein